VCHTYRWGWVIHIDGGVSCQTNGSNHRRERRRERGRQLERKSEKARVCVFPLTKQEERESTKERECVSCRLETWGERERDRDGVCVKENVCVIPLL